VRSIPDIYDFDYALLAGEEGFKEKKIARIRAGVELSKSRPFARVLAALGFEGLASAGGAALIAHGFDCIDKIIDCAEKNDWETFAQIEGIGETTARLLVEHFRKARNLELIARLRKIGLQFQAAGSGPEKIDDSFANQIWVITGSFADFVPRSLAAAEIEKRGGKIAENVSARTSFLLSGANPGSKLARAEKLGVKIVREADFLELIQAKKLL
jgi:DNA ligase (NAD+)